MFIASDCSLFSGAWRMWLIPFRFPNVLICLASSVGRPRSALAVRLGMARSKVGLPVELLWSALVEVA